MDGEAKLEAITRRARLLAEAWIDSLKEDERSRWIAMSANERTAATDRAQALISVAELAVPPKQAAAGIGMNSGRFYQLLRSWNAENGRSIGALGLGVAAGTPRADRKATADGKARALAAMHDLLDEETHTRTGAALKAAVDAGGDFSSTSLLRWWVAERRRRGAGLLGSTVAFDFCPLALARSDGRLHAAAFIVDRGTRTVLGAALASAAGQTSSLYLSAAADALDRLPRLRLAASQPAARFRSVSVATVGDGPATLDLLKRIALSKAVVRTDADTSLFGRSVVQAAGRVLAGVRLIPGAMSEHQTAMAPEHLAPTSYEEARSLLRTMMEADAAAVSSRPQPTIPAVDNPALDRLTSLLRRAAGDDAGMDSTSRNER